MLIRVSPDLSKEEIWAEGPELVDILGRDRDEQGRRIHERPYSEKELVAEISNPILLTDIHAISKLEPTKRDTVFALYGRYPRTIEYDGVSVWWDPRKHKHVWCPTIDTLVFANAMRTSDVLTEDVEKIADIGCASGFLGKYALYKCENSKELHLVDINPNSILCAMDNLKEVKNTKIISYYVMDGRKLTNKGFDLVLCSPPYVPRPRSIEDNPYEGVGLLHDMIVNGKKYLSKNGKLIVTTSTLCERVTKEAIEKAKKEGGLKSVEKIGEKRIPLKVMSILNNEEWVQYLYDIGLRKTLERGYEFWHEINILKLEYE